MDTHIDPWADEWPACNLDGEQVFVDWSWDPARDMAVQVDCGEEVHYPPIPHPRPSLAHSCALWVDSTQIPTRHLQVRCSTVWGLWSSDPLLAGPLVSARLMLCACAAACVPSHHRRAMCCQP